MGELARGEVQADAKRPKMQTVDADVEVQLEVASIPPVIVIWDLDETLILFDSLSRDAEPNGKSLGADMSKSLFALLDGVFSFRELEGVQIDSLAQLEVVSESASLLIKVVERYRCRDEWESRIPPRWTAERAALLAQLDVYSDCWLPAAINALEHNARRGGINYLCTSSHAVAALGKLAYFNLDGFFAPEKIYSSCHRSKTAAFENILVDHARKFKRLVPIVLAVGDGEEERIAAESLDIQFYGIKSIGDLKAIPEKLASLGTRDQ